MVAVVTLHGVGELCYERIEWLQLLHGVGV